MTLIVWCVLYLMRNIVVVGGECFIDDCDPDSCYQYICESCVSGHYLRSGFCLPCADDCTTCDGALSCTECTKGYWGDLCHMRCTAGCTNGCSIWTGRCSTSLNTVAIAGGSGSVVVIIIIIIVVICLIRRKRNKDKMIHQTVPVPFNPGMPVASPTAVQYNCANPYLNPVSQPQYTPPIVGQQAYPLGYSHHVNPAFSSYVPPVHVQPKARNSLKSTLKTVETASRVGNALGELLLL